MLPRIAARSAALLLLGCLRHATAAEATAAAAVAAGSKTKYVVHYMPWFTGPGTGHWCNQQWGNAWYESVLGEYDVSDPAAHSRQLRLMRAAGIDGLWLDFQKPDWIPRIQVIVEEAARLGLNFAVVADNYSDEHIVNSMREALQAWMLMPNYYRVDGRPVLPLFETPHRWGGRKAVLPDWEVEGQRPFVIGVYHWYQDESEPLPSGIDSLFFWHSPDLNWLGKVYYKSTRFSVKVGSIYRGWREAYTEWHHSPPYLGYLNGTLELARENEPEFAQVVTWNDYSEGTMLEPSFLRAPGGCVDPTLSYWNSESWSCEGFGGVGLPCTPGWEGSDRPCSGSGDVPCARIEDCSKPAGVAEGAAAEACQDSAALLEQETVKSAYSDLAMVAEAITGTPPAEAISLFKTIVASVTTTSAMSATFQDGSGLGFEPADSDGAADAACRGASAQDDSSSYYAVHAGVRSLDECKSLCVAASACTGVEFWSSVGRCEVWARHIGAKVAKEGFTCLRVQNVSTTSTATVTAAASEVPMSTSSATSTSTTSTAEVVVTTSALPAATTLTRTSTDEAHRTVAADSGKAATISPAPPPPADAAIAAASEGDAVMLSEAQGLAAPRWFGLCLFASCSSSFVALLTSLVAWFAADC